jgi:thioredoxin reductase
MMLGRCRRTVLVCDVGEPRNAAAAGLHNYLTRDGIRPLEFLRLAQEEVRRYLTVEFRRAEVVDAERTPSGFTVVCADGSRHQSRKLLLATGVVDELPEIPGLEQLYGTSVHHCPYCDAWEWRDQPLAVYGRGEEGPGLALALTVWSRDVVLCTGGAGDLPEHALQELNRAGIEIREEQIVQLEGREGKLERIAFDEGPPLNRRALFVCSGHHQRSDLAAKLGCRFNSKGAVDTGFCEATNVPGLYVAGDSSKDAQFVIVAAAEGAEAGMAINQALLKEDLAQNRSSTPSRIRRGAPYAKSG